MTARAPLGQAFASFLANGDLRDARALDGAGPPGDPSERAGSAVLALVGGGFAAADTLARLVLDAAAETGEMGTDSAHAATVVARSVRAAVARWRGDAESYGPTSGDRWIDALGLALMADAACPGEPADALAWSERAVGLAERAGDEALLRWADRARVNALLASGQWVAAAALARRLADPNPAESARHDRLRGTAALRLGDAGAAFIALTAASEVLAGAGFQLELVLTLLALAEADPDHAREHLSRARETVDVTGRDAAFDRLWANRPTLEVSMLGRQSLAVGGQPVRGKTSHADKLVFSLVLAGPHGLDSQTLCERLWSDKDLDKAMGSLTTATWEARVALGGEAWRLERIGEQLTLDLEGARVDLDDTIGALDRGERDPSLLERLEQPLLPAWRFEDWVVDADERRAARALRYR